MLDCKNLLKLVKTDDFIIKEGFKISKTSIIKYLSNMNNITYKEYETKYYQSLKDFILSNNIFTFELSNKTEFLKLM